MKKGDKVRFVSEVGGGIIAGFQGNNIVLVEDEDGFQIPTPINDVVVVNEEDYSISRVVANKTTNQKTIVIPEDNEDYDPADRPVTFKAPAEERKGGEKLNVYLAFVPMNTKAITSSRFETYIVNDSNYYVHYSYMTAEGNSWTLHATGEVDPNTKLFIEEFGREDLADMEHITIQLIAYKRKKPFLKKNVIDSEFRIDPVKFYKLHTFEDNDFFEQPALIHTIVENDQLPRPLVLDAKQLKKEMMQKVREDLRPVSHAPKPKDDKDAPIVVDLHINALLDSTAGMSASDILNFQLEKMRNAIFEHKNEKGRKIIFIHGKGEGILRQAVINELRYRFKQMPYQDASFQEYGYGATQVTIK
ncbi:MAG: DUF2027 domain-containing protein [Prevotella sp.]|nr:DUF2027 domain-containing protein [Prevotella sp.]